MDVAVFLKPSRVISRLQGSSSRQVLQALATVGAQAVNLDAERVYSALLENEESATIGLGRGSAIPYALIDGLEAPLGVFAKLEPAVDFGAVDGLAADLVMMILAPCGNDQTLLRALSCTARRFREGDVSERLRSASSAKDLYAILVGDGFSEPENKRNPNLQDANV